MANDVEVLDKNFLYNNMMARALVQLFPEQERSQIFMWLEKLQSVAGNKDALSIRNDYMWLMLLVMQSGNLTEPFDKLPPTRELPPVSEIVPSQVYEDVLSSSDQNFSWIDKIISDTNITDENGMPTSGMPPYKFFEHQPQPMNGIICYFSVFSKDS
ncbi:uncharacterized protein LOC112494740 [Cephus cinctus]|uniref:Uncharacterized protein LOC112494740 n=1 Tax=Cephus cinctus TaxID=211228 RepID=A0AAJ7RMY5_CEPCN|nr:uncharacterized protein LOC112494740 [Cephus cinctus]